MESWLRRARGVLVTGVTVLCACGGSTSTFDAASAHASATGSVRATRSGSDLVLVIHVDQLDPPAEVKKGATEYVVWAKPARGGPARNLGVLKRFDGHGHLRTRTAAETLSLIVTAEPNGLSGAPSGEPLLSAYVAGDGQDAGSARADAGERDPQDASQAEQDASNDAGPPEESTHAPCAPPLDPGEPLQVSRARSEPFACAAERLR